MHEVIKTLKKEIKAHDKPEYKVDIQRFFKEKLKNRFALRGPIFKKISSKCFKEIQSLSKTEILNICDEIIKSDIMHARGFAFDWATRVQKDYTKSDFTRFEGWLKNYVDSWATCDTLCCGALGILIHRFPELSPKRKKWAASKNRWLKRAAAVSLIVSVRDGLLLDDVFETADILLTDEDDMVRKGYGWMLKDASLKFPEEVFAYVLKNKNEMPRTALRYAIERYSKEKRKRAMAKD